MSNRSQQAAARAAARAAEHKAAARKKQVARLGAVAGVLVVTAAAAALTVANRNSTPSTEASAGTAADAEGTAADRTTAPPWPALPDGLAERTAALAFPAVGDESYHAHTLLTVFRNGEQVEVPANIGFDRSGAHSSLHTHTPDGVIHMEADDPYPYTVQELFTVWGVALDTGPETGRLGADTNGPDGTVQVYVNGKAAPIGPVPMKDGDNIVVAYGMPGSFPTAPPSTALDAA